MAAVVYFSCTFPFFHSYVSHAPDRPGATTRPVKLSPFSSFYMYTVIRKSWPFSRLPRHRWLPPLLLLFYYIFQHHLTIYTLYIYGPHNLICRWKGRIFFKIFFFWCPRSALPPLLPHLCTPRLLWKKNHDSVEIQIWSVVFSSCPDNNEIPMDGYGCLNDSNFDSKNKKKECETSIGSVSSAGDTESERLTIKMFFLKAFHRFR